MLVNLLLELNIINVQDIDREINKLAARLIDPRARKWFQRVPRFFLINIERLLEPYVVKAEPRGRYHSKFYADPRGGFLKGPGREPPPQPGSPLPVREQYDPKKRTYTTMLHVPVVQKEIKQSYIPFSPKKAKAKELFGGPPSRDKLEPWMTAPESAGKTFYHFDPIQVRRRELYRKLDALVNYLNYQAYLIQNPNPDDPEAETKAQEAEKLMQHLESMRTDDLEGFRFVLQDAERFIKLVNEKPWLFTNDGKIIATHKNLVLRKVILPQTAIVFSKRGQPKKTLTPDPNHPGLYYPAWCTKTSHQAEFYTSKGPLYFIDKNNFPYVLAHFNQQQVHDVHNDPINSNIAKEIAPLFIDPDRFPYEELAQGSSLLASEVMKLRAAKRAST